MTCERNSTFRATTQPPSSNNPALRPTDSILHNAACRAMFDSQSTPPRKCQVHLLHCLCALFPSATPFAVLPPFLRDNIRADLLVPTPDSLGFLSLMPDQVAYLSLGTVIDPLIAFPKHVNIRCCQLVESAIAPTQYPHSARLSTTYGDVAMPCSVNHSVSRAPLQI
jgi:hypothetical protein